MVSQLFDLQILTEAPEKSNGADHLHELGGRIQGQYVRGAAPRPGRRYRGVDRDRQVLGTRLARPNRRSSGGTAKAVCRSTRGALHGLTDGTILG